jgi:virulence-associated protein VagC
MTGPRIDLHQKPSRARRPDTLMFSQKRILLAQQGDDLIILRLQSRQDGHDELGWSIFRKARHHALHVLSHPMLHRGSQALA